MAINEENIIYMLTKADVEDAAEAIGLEKLTELHYRKAKEAFGYFVARGLFTWADALGEGLRDAEEELLDEYDEVPEKNAKLN